MKVGKKHSKSSTETFAERLALNPIGSLRRRSDFYLDFRRLSLSLVRRLEKRERPLVTVYYQLNYTFTMASTLVMGLGVATAAFLVREPRTFRGHHRS